MISSRYVWTAVMLAAGPAMSAGGCTQVISEPDAGKAALAAAPSQEAAARDPVSPVADLPFAGGRTFATLDEYLAFRRELGTMDKPFYREVKPGLYELDTGRGPKTAPPERYTRAELLAKFGFSE